MPPSEINRHFFCCCRVPSFWCFIHGIFVCLSFAGPRPAWIWKLDFGGQKKLKQLRKIVLRLRNSVKLQEQCYRQKRIDLNKTWLMYGCDIYITTLLTLDCLDLECVFMLDYFPLKITILCWHQYFIFGLLQTCTTAQLADACG